MTRYVRRYYLVHSLLKKGWSRRRLATRFKVTRTRIYQILKSDSPPLPQKPADKFWKDKPKWMQSGRDRVREKVRARDKYRCQGCGFKWKMGTRRLDVHHIKGLCGKKSRKYDSAADMKYLITLCHQCHYNRHDFSKAGKRSLKKQK